MPNFIWSNDAMDFIKGLSRVNNKTVILTVLDHLLKAAHFIPSATPTRLSRSPAPSSTRSSVSTACRRPSSVTATQSSPATYGELFGLSGTKFQMSSAFHP
jgi:hypothetical protein